jgi:hypothetical protein
LERKGIEMRKILLFSLLALAACGPHDRCIAPPQPKLMSLADMSLDDKANALGVPPAQVPGQPKSASSYGALMSGLNDNAEAQSVYASFIDHKNAALRQQYCVENEAYKARGMKDDMGTISHAVMATCRSDDEASVLALLLKYRNCASGNS